VQFVVFVIEKNAAYNDFLVKLMILKYRVIFLKMSRTELFSSDYEYGCNTLLVYR